MASPLLCRPNRIIQRLQDGVRLFTDSKVRGPRHRNIRDLPQADIRTVICGLFMFAGIDPFRSFIATVPLIVRRCVASVLRIRACLVHAPNFGGAFRRDSVSRAFGRPMVNSNVFPLNEVNRGDRLRPIFQVTNGATCSNAFVLVSGTPCRYTMSTFDDFVGRLSTRVNFNVQYLDSGRWSKDVFVSTIRRSRV